MPLLDLEGATFVATATAIGVSVDAVRMPISFATASRQIFAAWPALIVAIIGVVIGTLASERVLRSIPERLFRETVSAILLAIGLVLLVTNPR